MRRLLPKKVLVGVGGACLTLLCLYYYLATDSLTPNSLALGDTATSGPVITSEACGGTSKYVADIETADIFPTLDMQPPWMERREYWGNEMEDRFQRRKPLWSQLPLRVIVMPHSHNDPGWLKTLEGYFATATKNIITNMVNKLTEHRNMTFIWTEMVTLSMWWEGAGSDLRSKLRNLLSEGRLEVPTGGWVMTDEANVELYSMVDQLIEGHSFLRNKLNVLPKSSWSVDSFGHGGAFPHLLSKAGVENMVIMRTHFAWKEWFARYQQGNFLWKQAWEKDGSSAPLCHLFPYDIYSIKHSCGPHPQTCLGFDFRHVEGEYNEFTAHYTPIDSGNLATRAQLLLEQYGRTGSLVPHNVVLVPLGDDFRYNKAEEFDQQYVNYMKIMEHINSNPNYHAQVTFGTLSDYFREVRSRMSEFTTLTGDFHVYSDIFSEGRPAYWSGYYATRPFAKLLSRQLAGKLRSTEILFTLATSLARSQADQSEVPVRLLETHFDQLEEARRALGLFQHHDAITGTGKSFVMQDYVSKLLSAMTTAERLTEITAQYLLQENHSELSTSGALRHIMWRGKEGTIFQNTLDIVVTQEHRLVVVNSLLQDGEEVVGVRTNSHSVCVHDAEGNELEVQIAPSYNSEHQARLDLGLFDVMFLANLPALSLTTFTLTFCDRSGSEFTKSKTQVFCLGCPDSSSDSSPFSLNSLQAGAVQLENHVYSLMFDPVTKLLRNVTNKLSGHSVPLDMEFPAYPSSPFRSGAYLFAVDRSREQDMEDMPLFSEKDLIGVLIVSGPVFAQLQLVWNVAGEAGDSTFSTKTRLIHATGPIGEGIWLENMFDFGPSPNMKDWELVMRLRSGLTNGRRFYTDQSGLGMIRREWVEQAGLEGNYFPVTGSIYLQDRSHRLSLLVDHATGAASPAEGWLEVMVDRRTMYDDARGMGEGVLDSRATTHTYWLLLEPQDPTHTPPTSPLDSLSPLAMVLSRQLDNRPSILHTSKSAPLAPQLSLITAPLPCDHHLLGLRSWTPRQPPDSPQALMILQRFAPDCNWASLSLQQCRQPSPLSDLQFQQSKAKYLPTSLTGNFKVERSTEHLFELQPMEISAFNVTFT